MLVAVSMINSLGINTARGPEVSLLLSLAFFNLRFCSMVQCDTFFFLTTAVFVAINLIDARGHKTAAGVEYRCILVLTFSVVLHCLLFLIFSL